MSTQNDQGGQTLNSPVDASRQQMTPSRTAAMSTQNNKGGWMMDNQTDASFWQQMNTVDVERGVRHAG